jgi:hypothetical protein
MTITTQRARVRTAWGDAIRFTVSPLTEGEGQAVASNLGTASFQLLIGLTADGAAALSLTSASYFTVLDASEGTVSVTVPFSAYSSALAEGVAYFAELWVIRSGTAERVKPAFKITLEKSIRS